MRPVLRAGALIIRRRLPRAEHGAERIFPGRSSQAEPGNKADSYSFPYLIPTCTSFSTIRLNVGSRLMTRIVLRPFRTRFESMS